MALTAPEKAARKPVEAGPTRGVLYMIADIGTQLSEFDNKSKHQVCLGWELPDHVETFKDQNGKSIDAPRMLFKFYTLSMHEKAGLRLMIEAWRGKAFSDEEAAKFDLFSMAGKTAMLNIIHKTKKMGGVKADVGSITALPKGMSVCTNVAHPILLFSLNDPEHNTITGDMPAWLQTIIMKSDEWKAEHGDTHDDTQPAEEPF